MNTSWIRIIHVAKNKTGIDEEAYRGILESVGVSSSKDIETLEQFNLVMDVFYRFGFQYSPHTSSASGRNRASTVDGNPGYITKRQEYYIRGLQQLAMRVKDDTALRTLIKRIGKVDDIRYLPKKNAAAVILALRDICWKAGINPDHREERRLPCS